MKDSSEQSNKIRGIQKTTATKILAILRESGMDLTRQSEVLIALTAANIVILTEKLEWTERIPVMEECILRLKTGIKDEWRRSTTKDTE